MPTQEQLAPLLAAVDTACWALAVKQNTKKGQRCRADWKASLAELQTAWDRYQLAVSPLVAVVEDA